MKNLIKLFSAAIVGGFLLASCAGPMGPAGADANETCKECHNPENVDAKAVEFEFSKHSYGEAAFEEAGNTSCTPCHTSEAYKYVSLNNTPATFTLNTSTNKYANDYAVPATNTLGEINCFTCHASLHTTYAGTDYLPLTNNKAVAMTMWKGAKSIDLTQDDGMSNLCVKCHQPRPLTTSTTLSNGDVVDYASLISSPNTLFYDNTQSSTKTPTTNKIAPSYRMHVHYGTIGAIYAGKGGVEFAGTKTYSNSAHTAGASCKDCHMATVNQRAGGHTFKVKAAEGALSWSNTTNSSSTAMNFNGCNTTNCHSGISNTATTFWTTPRNSIRTLLNTLSGKINAVGGTGNPPILHSSTDPEANLWAGYTTGNWDGYLDIYDPSTNPTGLWRNPAPGSSWTTAQNTTNSALLLFPSLKNAVMGAMVNFQLCLREYSLGIHNYKYTEALLQNSIEAMTAAGY